MLDWKSADIFPLLENVQLFHTAYEYHMNHKVTFLFYYELSLLEETFVVACYQLKHINCLVRSLLSNTLMAFSRLKCSVEHRLIM